ncbi:MAG: NAD(P)H-dependent oxidoreductase [Pyrinomonadaceae bacterium]
MTVEKRNLLVINGSIRGSHGNSGRIVDWAQRLLAKDKKVGLSLLTLADPMPAISEVRDLLASHDGFFVVTGNYWNNGGSALQRFLEVVTFCENGPEFFGKPFACAVTMDSVGGIDVASHLHTAFSGLGCWSPPCSTVIISRVAEEAIQASKGKTDDPNEDVWRIDDLEILLNNLVASCHVNHEIWRSWPCRELPVPEGDWPESGPLDLGSIKFL